MKKLLAALILLSACSAPIHKQTDDGGGAMVAAWEENLTEAIMVDMFPPPTAARIYAYSNIALYETLRHLSPEPLTSLGGKLNDLPSLPVPDTTHTIDYKLAAITAFSEVGATLVYTKNIVRDFETRVADSLKATGIDPQMAERSVAYGKDVAKAVLAWASTDRFKETRGMIRYTLLHEPGSWEPTPPDYLPGAEPHWNKIRPMTLDSASLFTSDTLPVPFSADKNSAFYRLAADVVRASASLDSNQIAMAAFWDDNPGVSSVFGHMKHIKKKRTPGGHWMALIGQIAGSKNMRCSVTAQWYALASIAVFDGFISCWDAKYRFQTIRPITYIHRHITDDWQPLLQTPPFPEYPSGHATISAAAATVLTSLAGDGFSYTDSTEFRFGLPIRSFTSFIQAAEECAASRFYGGIHFMPSNLAGTEAGKKVGEHVLKTIK